MVSGLFRLVPYGKKSLSSIQRTLIGVLHEELKEAREIFFSSIMNTAMIDSNKNDIKSSIVASTSSTICLGADLKQLQ